jgi:hypothetical protein
MQQYRVTNTRPIESYFSNYAYVNADCFSANTDICVNGFVLRTFPRADVPPGDIAIDARLRDHIGVDIGVQIPKQAAPRMPACTFLECDVMRETGEGGLFFMNDEEFAVLPVNLVADVHQSLLDMHATVGRSFYIRHQTVWFRCVVTHAFGSKITGATKIILRPGDAMQNTTWVQETQDAVRSFEYADLGVGGIGPQFREIFERVFASRVFPTQVVQQLGVQHVRGFILHGPPGTGKTLLARNIIRVLNTGSVQVVNGPELLNSYVGKSEENLRQLFADADRDQAALGSESPLHVVIFDEIDALCCTRDSRSTSHNDSIVTQLLTKMDGVSQLNNILVIGITNRLESIDRALLRPGRFEVCVEIPLPTEEGRKEIFAIHTSKLPQQNTYDLDELAALSEGMSGADIAGAVRAAVLSAMYRCIGGDVTKGFACLKPAAGVVVQIGQEDICRAIERSQKNKTNQK